MHGRNLWDMDPAAFKPKKSLVEERRRSEWDRGYRNRKQMMGGLPPGDSDRKYHDTREYNVDGDTRTVSPPTKP